jgi:hypothetical protein
MTRGASASLGPALRSLRPQSTPRHFLHENRETSEAPTTVYRGRSAGKGDRRTARMHVSEESDSGVVPMKHSNKDRRSSAESAEGRPLVKENTHPSHTCPTQCGKRVSQGWMGVRRAAYRFAAMYPRQEPYALMSARTDPCGGQRATAVPTATPEMCMKTKDKATHCPTQKATFPPGCMPFYTAIQEFCSNCRLLGALRTLGNESFASKCRKLEGG